MEEMSFEPFYDFESVSEPMIDDLHAAVVEYRSAADIFDISKSKDNAIRVLKSQREVAAVYESIMEALWTVPAMVHLAGERKVEEHPETGREGTLQRCTRCGSMLQVWFDGMAVMTPEGPHEVEFDEVPWWEPGAVVARANHAMGMQIYEISDRPLRHYEHECVNISEIGRES